MLLNDFKIKYKNVLNEIDLYKEKYVEKNFKSTVKDIAIVLSVFILLGFGFASLASLFDFIFSGKPFLNFAKWAGLFALSFVVLAKLTNEVDRCKAKLESELVNSLEKLLTNDFLKDLWSCALIKDDKALDEEFKDLIGEIQSDNKSFKYMINCLEDIFDTLEIQSVGANIIERFNEIKSEQTKSKFSV